MVGNYLRRQAQCIAIYAAHTTGTRYGKRCWGDSYIIRMCALVVPRVQGTLL